MSDFLRYPMINLFIVYRSCACKAHDIKAHEKMFGKIFIRHFNGGHFNLAEVIHNETFLKKIHSAHASQNGKAKEDQKAG